MFWQRATREAAHAHADRAVLPDRACRTPLLILDEVDQLLAPQVLLRTGTVVLLALKALLALCTAACFLGRARPPATLPAQPASLPPVAAATAALGC